MPYSSMEAVNPAIKGIKPPVTLAQANGIARVADSVTGVDNPWAVAIAQFKKSHVAKGGKWVKKEGSEWGKKAVTFQCECLDCGYKMSSKEHCADIKCPECGSTMRRAERPGPGRKELIGGVKALEIGGDRYVALWTTNAFEDDEQEIFSTKSIEEYVARCDEDPELRGRVWFWHVKGTDYADIVWQGVEGRILIELAKVDDTEYGRKMFYALQHPEEYPELLPQGWGTSHGYVYKRGSKQNGVYNWFHKFESTTLPLHRASNKYGGVQEVIDMSVTKEKAKGLAAVVGEDLAKEMLDAAKATGGNLEQMVDFKEQGEKAVAKPVKAVTEEDEDEEMTEEEAAAAEEEKKKAAAKTKGDDDAEVMEMELDDDLLNEIASHVPVEAAVEKAMKELLPKALAKAMADQAAALTAAVKEAVESANVSSKEEIVKGAVAGTLRLHPYVASKADDNVVAEKDLDEHLVADTKAKDQGDVVSQIAQRMLAGTL